MTIRASRLVLRSPRAAPDIPDARQQRAHDAAVIRACADATDRLAWFTREAWVDTPSTTQAITLLSTLLDGAARGAPEQLLLLAPHRAGKTRLLRQFAHLVRDAHPQPEAQPALLVPLPVRGGARERHDLGRTAGLACDRGQVAMTGDRHDHRCDGAWPAR